MKTNFTFLLTFIFFFIVSCKKESLSPQLNNTETVSLSSDLQSCQTYFYYQGRQPKNLGPIFTDKIILGFKKGTNQVNKAMTLALFPEIQGILTETQTNIAPLTIVGLKPNLTCLQIDKLLKDLPLSQHIEFANGYFSYPDPVGSRVSTTNSFVISLLPNRTISDLSNVIKLTKTEMFMDLGFGLYFFKTTKQSPYSCIQTANLFYESGLCETAEPDFYFEFAPAPL